MSSPHAEMAISSDIGSVFETALLGSQPGIESHIFRSMLYSTNPSLPKKEDGAKVNSHREFIVGTTATESPVESVFPDKLKTRIDNNVIVQVVLFFPCIAVKRFFVWFFIFSQN